MKRSHQQEIRNSSDCRKGFYNIHSRIVPVLIEAEGDTGRNNKRPRNNATALNLLIQAMVEGQPRSSHNYNSTDASYIASSIALRSSTASNATNSRTTNSVIDRVPSGDRSVSSASRDENIFSSRVSLSPLPSGRPLMPPPRLQLFPREVRFSTTNLMALEMTLLHRDSKSTITDDTRYRKKKL